MLVALAAAVPSVVSWVVVMVLEARSQRQARERVRRRHLRFRPLVVWHDVVFSVPHVMNIGVWSSE